MPDLKAHTECVYCDDDGRVETDNNGPIGACPICKGTKHTAVESRPKKAGPRPHRLLHEAADEIERLRAECLRLSHGLAESMALVMNHEGAIERLRAELAEANKRALRRERVNELDMTPESEREHAWFDEIKRLRAELATTKSSEFEGWRYADELEQERKRLTADLADLQSHFDSTALHDGIVIDALRADLAEGKRLVKAQKINPSIGPSDVWIKLLAWAYGSAIGDKTSPDEHRAPAAAEKPA